VITIKIEKEDFFSGKVSERIIEIRDNFLLTLIFFITTKFQKVAKKRAIENENQRHLPRNRLPYRRQSSRDRARDSHVPGGIGYRPERSQGFMHSGLQKHRVVTRSFC